MASQVTTGRVTTGQVTTGKVPVVGNVRAVQPGAGRRKAPLFQIKHAPPANIARMAF